VTSKSSPAKSVHPGARWVRAALQVNPYSYKGKASPSASYQDEPSYNADLLDACERLGIEMIGVTDHWNIDSAVGLIADAEKRGIVALPGFEANSSEGVHLLVLFEAGTKPSAINAAIGKCGGDPGKAGKTGAPFKEILDAMSVMGALVVPAHANVAKSGMLTSRAGAPLVEMIHHRHLHAVAITPTTADATEQRLIFRRTKPYDRPYPLAKVHADDVSSPATLEKVGATSWFKMSTPCLASLRHAVLIPSTRVRVDDPTASARAILREISWQGGFLDGVTITFSDDLTNLIGGRGTGKSTIVESLRYALDIQPLGQGATVDHNSIVKDVLGAGTTLRLVVDAVTPTAGRYAIQRTVFGPPIVLDSAGVATQLRPEDVIGSVDIYGQHELAELAQDGTLIASMISRFSKPTSAGGDRVDLLAKLTDSRARISKAEKSLARLEAEVADIPRLTAQAARFTDTNIAERLDELQRLRLDAAVFKSADDRVDEARAYLANLNSDEVAATLDADMGTITGSTQEALLKRAEAASKKIALAIVDASKSLETAIEEASSEIRAASADWGIQTSKKKTEHDQVLRELTDEGADPEKYLATTAALEALRVKSLQVPIAKNSITSLMTERRTLLASLALNEAALNKDLSNMIRDANAATSDAIRIQSTQSARRDDMTSLVAKSVSGQRTQIIAAINEDGFSPAAFVTAVRAGSAKLEKSFFIKGAQATALIAAGEPFLREFEELRVDQAVQISLDTSVGGGSPNWKKLSQLSKGQRATALLLLLLGASQSPLLIDQPEDDLDNRFVFKEIVKKLRGLKGNRQVISSTHNANIPVLGDAELIVVLEGDGTNAWVVNGGEGSLDNPVVLGLAEDLLEGGREAFSDRQHLYGF
jgi:ABC-type Mn2+/Zn2+ transport system ATPase subunit